MIKAKDTPDLLAALVENLKRPIAQRHMRDQITKELITGAQIKNIDLDSFDLTRGMTLTEASQKAKAQKDENEKKAAKVTAKSG